MSIVTTTNSSDREGVLARDIWASLGIKDSYSHWFSAQVQKFELVCGIDYVLLGADPQKSMGRPTIDHILSKEAAVKVQAGNRKVADAIAQKVGQMELQKHSAAPKSELAVLTNAMQLMQEMAAIIADKQEQEEFYKPYITFASRVQESEDCTSIAATAKLMDIPSLGPNNFFKYLRDKKVLMSDPQRRNMPYQEYIDRGYLVVKLANVNDRNIPVSMFTGKGLLWLQQQLIADGLLLDETDALRRLDQHESNDRID